MFDVLIMDGNSTKNLFFIYNVYKVFRYSKCDIKIESKILFLPDILLIIFFACDLLKEHDQDLS